jgi:hypothetical protein
MKQFEIVPNVGIGPIKLGMTMADVRSTFGPPESATAHRLQYFGCFFVDLDDNGKVEFIEVAKTDAFVATYLGHDLHRMEAKNAVDFVVTHAPLDDSHPEHGHSYIFPQLQMSLWRSTMPDSDEDLDGRYFEAVGIGRADYFSAVK